MKVHVLWYAYYEDSCIIGIYTEEGKKKKIEELQRESIGYCKEWGEEYEKTLIKKKEERTIHLRKVNQAIEACKSSPENKSFRQLKRSLIKEDESLGEGFRIGHSYLCNIKSENVEEKLNYIVEYELIPLLKEYWFDEQEKVEYWSNRLRSVINDSI